MRLEAFIKSGGYRVYTIVLRERENEHGCESYFCLCEPGTEKKQDSESTATH